MLMFPSFKLPQLLRKSSPGSEICEDVPRFKCSELPVKQRIGQGSFGDVYTSEYKGAEDTECQTVCSGKRTSRPNVVPRKSRPEKMPSKPGDTLQRHSFNQSRKL